MTDHFKQFDALRRRLGAIDNDLIDELLAGRLDRRMFLRHGAMLGLSLPVLGSMASLAGLGAFPTPARAQGKPGGVIRVAIATPAGAIDPVTVADDPGLTMLIQAGEFLCLTQPDLTLKPVLAESWTHNDDTSVWTFKLRPNVKYQSGGTLVAADVVASIDRLCDPANSSNALSAFKGILSKGKTKALDDLTVEFTLDAPYGSFPYVVSSDNYNCIILPASFKGDYEKNWDGTGPFRLDKFTPKVGASFVRNDAYWGSKALPDRTEFTFYDALQPRILALQGGQVDLIDQLPVISGKALLNDPNITIIREKSTAHQQVHMRCDTGPLARQADPPGAGAQHRSQEARRRPAARFRRNRQRQPLRQGLPVLRPLGAAARSRHPGRQETPGRRRGQAGPQGEPHHRAISRDPAICRADPELRA